MPKNCSERNALISETIGKVRDKETESADFRKNLKLIGKYLAYETAEFLETEEHTTETPLGTAKFRKIKDNIVIITILRAALPMSEGVLEVIPKTKVGIISASRGKKLQEDGKDFRVDCTYSSIPFVENKTVVIVDPMLASGSTLSFIMNELIKQKPSKLVIICAIASEFGINRILEEFPQTTIIAGDIDKELNEKGYIVPGLGDAGDRAFNTL